MTLWSIRTPALASARSTSSTSGLWCSGACAFAGAGCGRLWAACRAVIGVSRAAKATIEAIRRRLRLDMASHSFMWSRRGRRWAASKSPEGRLPLTGLARHPWNAFLPYLRRALAEGYGRVFLPCQEVVCDGRRGDNRCFEQAAEGVRFHAARVARQATVLGARPRQRPRCGCLSDTRRRWAADTRPPRQERGGQSSLRAAASG